jgi:hypothetical protein
MNPGSAFFPQFFRAIVGSSAFPCRLFLLFGSPCQWVNGVILSVFAGDFRLFGVSYGSSSEPTVGGSNPSGRTQKSSYGFQVFGWLERVFLFGMNHPGGHSTAGSERRRSVRYACVLAAVDVSGNAAFVPVLPVMPGWPIRILDISMHGIGIHAGDELAEGAQLTIRLYSRGGQPSAARQVRIVRTSQQTDGTWIAGAEFIEPIAEEELQMLLGGNDDNG